MYHEQYQDGLLDEAISSRGFTRLFGAARLKDYRDSFRELPGNRQVCAATVGLPQSLLPLARVQRLYLVLPKEELLTSVRGTCLP